MESGFALMGRRVRRNEIVGPVTGNNLLADQQADSRGDGENRCQDAELSEGDPEGADDANEDQVDGEEEHSDVLFHRVQGRIVTGVPILLAL